MTEERWVPDINFLKKGRSVVYAKILVFTEYAEKREDLGFWYIASHNRFQTFSFFPNHTE